MQFECLSCRTPSKMKLEDGEQLGFICSIKMEKIAGLAALIVAAVLTLAAAVLASGLYGSGVMFFASGGLTLFSMISFAVSVCLLS